MRRRGTAGSETWRGPGFLGVAALYVGAVVGAGFASGQEILLFFGAHGPGGVAAALLSGPLFAAAGWVILRAAHETRSGSYRDLLDYAVGGRLGGVFDAGLAAMLLAGLAIVMAGTGALLHERFGLPTAAGLWSTAAIMFAVVLARLPGVVAANSLLVPFLTAVIAMMGAGVRFGAGVRRGAGGAWGGAWRPPAAAAALGGHWAAAAGLYVCYNSLLALVALAPLGRRRAGRAADLLGAGLGGAVLGLLAASVATVNLALYPEVLVYEVPLAHAAHLMGGPWRFLYAGALWAAMVTTGLAETLGLQSRMESAGLAGGPPSMALLLLVAAGLAHVGFARLIATVYPVMGYAGAALLVLLALRGLRGPRRPPGSAAAPVPPTGSTSGRR